MSEPVSVAATEQPRLKRAQTASGFLEHAHANFLDRLGELASRKQVTRRQWEMLAAMQPGLASKIGELTGVESGSPDAALLAVVQKEKQRREQLAVVAKEAKAEQRRAAIAAREAARAAAAAPAAAALRSAFKSATYKMPELERVLEKLEALEDTTSGAASRAAAAAAAATATASAIAAANKTAVATPLAGTTRTPRGTPRGGSSLRDVAPRVAAQRTALASARGQRAATPGGGRSVWSEYGGSGRAPALGGGGGAFAADASRVMEQAELALFVHFIPPPLRAEGKKDLPWIVHTCDGSGCREAKHVSFHAVTGFTTYESAPPEVAEGLACSCQIANHHLRGYGRVRWEGDHAIIEDESDGAGTNIDARAYMAKSKSLQARVKALQATERQLRLKLDAGFNGEQQVCGPCVSGRGTSADDIMC